MQQINENEQHLTQFSYTSCEPNDNAWRLSSEQLNLNHQTGLGTVKHAKIYLFDVPIFYFPYFQFPIDDKRHSGLLMPSFSFSKSNGHSLNIPYYWNIHPQMDSTIELSINSLRGVQINTETRYLTENTTGSILTSNLDDEETQQKRYYYRLKQQTQLPLDIHLDLLAQNVSEQDFFNDFNIITLAKTPDYLERHLTLKHKSQHWDSILLLQNHQILDETKSIASRPFEQWPKISSIGQYDILNESSLLKIDLSYVNFKKQNSVEGERFIINPTISSEWSNSYAFIKPSLSYSIKQYDLTYTDNSQEDISLNLATFSIDSGLFFERIASEEKSWLQTFEPRLFYLNTPFKDQSNIPDFDTANLSNTYANLFKNNRFSGGDRIGDTEQLTLGLSSRFLNLNSGVEFFSISLGQTFYAKDRRVQLSGTGISTEGTSDLFLELINKPHDHWTITANMTQQAETDFIKQKTFKVTHDNNKNIINFSYRFKGTELTPELEQTDLSFVYPINERWTVFAKKQYSLIEQQNVEQLLGASYDSCCWAFSVIALESTDDDFEDIDRSIYFQFTLKGLSSIGRNNTDLLIKSIPGYR